ncbi:DMT family transporter [Terricaulis silvestris]|uniref:Putative DMT superfamily transporter inner membrane protein n=1 Tax=Terricaulis silvestris TaxID=2686094 RepID=A0A6I6MIF4_9CAUL|nr:EamA family transporter [Terricaulis silvestris]QGZ93481.1 putative DMT superfamily transporter inner membrane protein [Terricaulis silvestris]
MSAEQSVPASAAAPNTSALDLIAIVFCTLAWGTTWFVITLQFGVVDSVVSVTYRFALAAVLLLAWCALRGERIMLTRAQHFAALGVGISTFTINYTLVYWAEERVTSAVVAVLFASMAFVNLIGFRIAFGQRSPLLAWGAASLGIAGVALMSWEELAAANFGAEAVIGIVMTLTGVAAAVVGNVYARRGELAGAGIAASTGWAMGYGAAALAVFALITGKTWAFEPTWQYALSLLYLAVIGSVIAFLLYYGLARRRGYSTASYISAMAPPVAMLVSAVFENKVWGLLALGGIALVVMGQLLLLRVKRA